MKVIAINYSWGAGFAIFMGLILLVAAIYTVIKLRKQVREREEDEEKKNHL